MKVLVVILLIGEQLVGKWRSLVAHLFWEQRVAGSNPVFPIFILAILFFYNKEFNVYVNSKRIGAKAVKQVPSEVLLSLNNGTIASCNLMEILAVDFSLLFQAVVPNASPSIKTVLSTAAPLGIVKRMQLAGTLLLQYCTTHQQPLAVFVQHTSDIVRGWACYALMANSSTTMPFNKRLEVIYPLANDSHFGVREWAWMALRPYVLPDILNALQYLQPWAEDNQPNIRRFACEVIRPRGVWCKHSTVLQQTPWLATNLLNTLHSDPSRYVQNSVANWLNDAAKTNPTWVKMLCTTWLSQPAVSAATQYICKQGTRSVTKQP